MQTHSWHLQRQADPSTDSLEWKPYTAEEKNVMLFDETSECKVLGDEDLCSLQAEALAAQAE